MRVQTPQSLPDSQGLQISDKVKITALYERLSQDDEKEGDSNSIVHQKEILEDYAKKNGFRNIRHFVDDGVSGTLFSRPGLDALLEEVKAGNVATIIIKDQSRIGRDVLEVGLLKRTFEEYNVRFIAANDGLDSANGFDIMSIFRDVFNEYFVADTSKKIRAVFKTKALNGRHSNSVAPYGYKPSEADKFVWAIDEPAAEVVRDIYRMCLDGIGVQYIAKELQRRGLKIPTIYKAERDGVPPRTLKRPDTAWDTSVVSGILENREYTGTAVLNRKTTKSYKDHKKFIKPEDEWIIHENAHPVIIEKEEWDTVQRIRKGKRKKLRKYERAALDGFIYCETCGDRLYPRRSTSSKNKHNEEREYYYYVCRNSRTYSDFPTCTSHSIKLQDIEAILFDELQEIVSLVKIDEQKFAEKLNHDSSKKTDKNLQKAKSELNKAILRIEMLNRIINKIYEDNVEGKISDERFQTMLGGYEREQNELKSRAVELEDVINFSITQTENIERFLSLVRSYTEITELTVDIVNEFADKIIVSEAVYTPAKYKHWARGKTQKVRVLFNYAGEVSELTEEE